LASRKSKKKASKSSRQYLRKTKKIEVRFEYVKSWVYQDLEKLVTMKNSLGFTTTLALEVARIVEDYMTGRS